MRNPSCAVGVSFVLDFIFEAPFGFVVEAILEFADRKKGLGLVLFLTLAGMMSFLTLLFLAITVKQVLTNDWMYAVLLMIVTVMMIKCTDAAVLVYDRISMDTKR